jgi:sulfite reductase (NADPH) flavoprotein alpha-component
MNTNISPLSSEQINLFTRLTDTLNKEQLAWVSGYLAGLSAKNISSVISEIAEPITEIDSQNTLTILYGSRTGNGEGLAKKALKMATELGLKVLLKSMADYKGRELQSEKNLLVIVSTHGEGIPPFAARELHEFIYSKRAPKLGSVTFAVLGLGDSSYFQFCKTGKDFDEQLEKLGAKRLVEYITCDVDFEETAESWLKTTLPAFVNDLKSLQNEANQYRISLPNKSGKNENISGYSKKNPFLAPVFDKILLHGKDSKRQTLHIELSTENAAGLEYEPGDAAGVLPVNSSELITEVLTVTGLKADETVTVIGQSKQLYDALYRDVELSKITVDVVTRFLNSFPNEQLQKLTEDPDRFKEYLEGRDIVDLFQDYPTKISAENLIKLLRPLQPRYYSISSSPKAFPGELHLTVGVVNYENTGREKRGTCSTFLSEVAVEDEKVPVFIESNPGFRLPEDDETPIIMVGAGTGIAPYRAFVQHRELAENRGKSWLFFGNRNFETEFLYQTEWQSFMKSGALTKMDVAFSRDGEKKVYVQDRLLEKSAEVYKWLEEGSHFYICGDMKNMARHVQNTLVKIVEKQGVMSKEHAQEYVANLEKDRRLQLDVY